MMGKQTLRFVALTLCLVGFLMMGCQPAGNSTPAASTNKTPEPKSDPKSSNQPKPDPG